MFSGTVHARDRLRFGAGLDDKVTPSRYSTAARRVAAAGGQRGPDRQALGPGRGPDRRPDRCGGRGDAGPQFPPPTLESVVVRATRPTGNRLRVALGQLAEQDPLINVRQDDERQEIYVSLYGEVQKEVIQSTLADDFGVAATFRETTMIYIERRSARPAPWRYLQSDDHPYSATVGLRVNLAGRTRASSSGSTLTRDDSAVHLQVAGPFAEAMTHYVTDSLASGLYGWPVTDCVVTMNDCDYYVGDGARKQVLPTPKTRRPTSAS